MEASSARQVSHRAQPYRSNASKAGPSKTAAAATSACFASAACLFASSAANSSSMLTSGLSELLVLTMVHGCRHCVCNGCKTSLLLRLCAADGRMLSDGHPDWRFVL